MMIHRHLIGLWAVLLLAPSAWTQEAGEEIIAKFKQSILDRRAAIRNCRYEVTLKTLYQKGVIDKLDYTHKKRKFIMENPELIIRYTLAYDRMNNLKRIIQEGDIIKTGENEHIEKVQCYTEYGFHNGIPLRYQPLVRNRYLSQEDLEGSICTYDGQSVVADAAPGLLPVYIATGVFPAPSMLAYPKDHYLNVTDILSPDIANCELEYVGQVTYMNEICHILRYYPRKHRHEYQDYTISSGDAIEVCQIIYSSEYVPFMAYRNINYQKIHEYRMPISWRREYFIDKVPYLISEFSAISIDCNSEACVHAARMPIGNTDSFRSSDAKYIEKSYKISGSEIIEVTEGNYVYIIIISIVLVLVGVVMVVWMVKRQASYTFAKGEP